MLILIHMTAYIKEKVMCIVRRHLSYKKYEQIQTQTNTQIHKHMVEKQAFIMVDGGVGGPLSALSDLHTKFTSRPHTSCSLRYISSNNHKF